MALRTKKWESNGRCSKCNIPLDDHSGFLDEKFPEGLKCPGD